MGEEPLAKKAKLTIGSFTPQGIVTIIVEGYYKVQMFKHLLCQNSEFFAVECQKSPPPTRGLFKEQYIVPPFDVSAEIFTLFLVWVSTGSLSGAESFIPFPTTLDDLEPEVASVKLAQLINCYHLSVNLVAWKFQNYIADQICAYLEYLAGKDKLLEQTVMLNIPVVYTNPLEDSKLKSILEDSVVYHGTGLIRCKLSDTPDVDTMVAAFWNGVALAAVREYQRDAPRSDHPWRQRNGCQYHEHPNEYEANNCREKRDKYYEVIGPASAL